MRTLRTRKEAAALLQVSTRTVVRYEQDRRLTPIRLSSRAVRYDDHEIEKLIEAATGGEQR